MEIYFPMLTNVHTGYRYNGQDLRVRLGEWDVNHDVEFYPYEERDVSAVHIHPEFYAGTLYNDIAILRLVQPIDTLRSPHIAPACLPDPHTDYAGSRCWTTGWGKDAFGDYGKYQNILKVWFTHFTNSESNECVILSCLSAHMHVSHLKILNEFR